MKTAVRKLFISSISIFIFMMASSAELFAQDELRIERAAIKIGITLHDIIQDSDGFIYVATYGGGLYRWDGSKLKIYQTGGPNSLSTNSLTDLYEDSEGLIWIGTGGGGLNKFDKKTNRFTTYTNDPNNPGSISSNTFKGWAQYAIIEDREGYLWAGTDNGLNKFDKETETFTRYLHDPDNPNTLSHNVVMAVSTNKDDSNIIWIATEGGGLNKFDKKTETFTQYTHDPANPDSLSYDTLTELIQDKDGIIWIATKECSSANTLIMEHEQISQLTVLGMSKHVQ